MKIQIEHGNFTENEIVLRCRELDEEMLEVLSLLKDRSSKLAGFINGEIHLLSPTEVYYAEAVDGRNFIYTRDTVLETSESLASLQVSYHDFGFLRIGKSQLVNLFQVTKLKSLPNSRIEITLKNSEKMIASRHYIQSLKERLGLLTKETYHAKHI